ncbi:hypothetical protein NDU88_004292 [Pleurodeles waltl]|uniref:Uncharacterized protein n=1 Tax=Pleurodeles waltl TaxID=8319 RepID=A0AAV7MWS4_PLEWA|nr:hypothetical protein NDU88_004292 [Pleurodeles waltl]
MKRRARTELLLKRETQMNERTPAGTFLRTEDSPSRQRPHLVAALRRFYFLTPNKSKPMEDTQTVDLLVNLNCLYFCCNSNALRNDRVTSIPDKLLLCFSC